jgi:hypothetical protein
MRNQMRQRVMSRLKAEMKVMMMKMKTNPEIIYHLPVN